MAENKNKKKNLKGKPIIYSQALIILAEKGLKKIASTVRAMNIKQAPKIVNAATPEQVKAIREAMEKAFQRSIDNFSKNFTSAAIKASKNSVKKSLAGIVENISPKLSKEGLNAAVQVYSEISQISKSFSSKISAEIQNAIFENVSNNMPRKDLYKKIMEIGVKDKKRARRIARDQTQKAVTAIAKTELQNAGIKKFIWKHTDFSKMPRTYHKKDFKNGGLNNGVFDIDNPPIADLKTKERALPGMMINCSCIMQPYLER
jgi:uncharacterized protein with gpF-like domain